MPQSIKQNDTVLVLAGKDRGKSGRVTRLLLKKRQVVVEGVNVVTKFVKERQGVAQAGIVKVEAPIDISNVALKDPNTEQSGRVGWRVLADGSKERFVKDGS